MKTLQHGLHIVSHKKQEEKLTIAMLLPHLSLLSQRSTRVRVFPSWTATAKMNIKMIKFAEQSQ